MNEPPRFQRGERVLIRDGRQVIAGEVLLASGNGQSIAVGYDGMVAGCVKVLPLLWDPGASAFRTIVNQEIIVVQKVTH